MQKLTDDIYVVLYYDESEEEIAQSVCESMESLQEHMKVFKVISWINITGQNMEIGEYNVNGQINVNDLTITPVE